MNTHKNCFYGKIWKINQMPTISVSLLNAYLGMAMARRFPSEIFCFHFMNIHDWLTFQNKENYSKGRKINHNTKTP